MILVYVFLWVMVAVQIFAAISTIASIGKTRPPLSAGVAVFAVTLNVISAIALVILLLQ